MPWLEEIRRVHHSFKQLEAFGHALDENGILDGLLPVLRTPDGYEIPLVVKDGLLYLTTHPPTPNEMMELPFILMTSKEEMWDPNPLESHDGSSFQGLNNGNDFLGRWKDDGLKVHNKEYHWSYDLDSFKLDGLADVLIAGDPPFEKNHELFLEEDEKKPRPEPEPPPTGSWWPTTTWSLRQRLVASFFGGSSFTVQDFNGSLTFPEVNLPMNLFLSLFLLRKMGSVSILAGFGMPPNASKWKHSGSLETSPTEANICTIGTLLGSDKWTMWTGSPSQAMWKLGRIHAHHGLTSERRY
jgi:hypothetical protein